MLDSSGCTIGIRLRVLGIFVATPFMLSRVIESPGQDTKMTSIRDQVRSGTGEEGSAIHIVGGLRYRGRIVVPRMAYLREEILREFHCSLFAVHPHGTKMYHNLHRKYYWSGMKQ